MNYFLHVLTPKGLNYLLRNDSSIELRQAIKSELQRRAKRDEVVEKVRERELDGYERDQ
jgi:hypothetical protein